MERGDIFGLDEKVVPVPWTDFKIRPKGGLLVLDTTKAIVEAAHRATEAQLRSADLFAAQSKKVDAYWATAC